MADDETIRIQVDSVEARAQLAALEKEVRELEAELKTLNSTAGVTSAEIEGTTRRLGEAKAKFAEAGEQVQKFNETQEEGGKKTQSLADKYVTLGLKVFGARQVLMAAGEAMRSVAQATGSYSGATKDAIDQTDNLLQSIASLDLIGASKALGQLAGQTVAWAEGLNEVNTELGDLADKNAADEFRKILKAQGDLVQGHEKETSALNLKAGALVREIATQRQAGEIQKWLRDEIEATVKAYEKAGEAVPAPLAAQVAALGITTDAQDKAAASAEKLEAAGVKSAEKRAEAEAKAADAVVAALEKERTALDAKIAQDEERLAKAQKATDAAEAGQFDSGVAPTNEEAEKLKATIKELNALPTQTPEQVAQLEAAKESLADLNLSIRKYNIGLGESGTIAGQVSAADEELNAQRDLGISLLERSQSLHDQAIDRLEQEEGGYGRLSASMQEFIDVGLKAGDGLQGTFSDAGVSATEAGNAVQFLSEQADDAVGSIEGVAEAAGSLGETTKEGTDKAKEGMDGISEAVGSLTGKLTEAEVVIDRIAVKLAALQLGS